MMWTFAALLAAVQAPSAPPAPLDDVRCFVATSSLISSAEPAINMVGMMGSMYFLGRIDGASAPDFERRVAEAEAKMTPADRASLLQTCGNLMKERGKAVEEIGKRISDRAAAPPRTNS